MEKCRKKPSCPNAAPKVCKNQPERHHRDFAADDSSWQMVGPPDGVLMEDCDYNDSTNDDGWLGHVENFTAFPDDEFDDFSPYTDTSFETPVSEASGISSGAYGHSMSSARLGKSPNCTSDASGGSKSSGHLKTDDEMKHQMLEQMLQQDPKLLARLCNFPVPRKCPNQPSPVHHNPPPVHHNPHTGHKPMNTCSQKFPDFVPDRPGHTGPPRYRKPWPAPPKQHAAPKHHPPPPPPTPKHIEPPVPNASCMTCPQQKQPHKTKASVPNCVAPKITGDQKKDVEAKQKFEKIARIELDVVLDRNVHDLSLDTPDRDPVLLAGLMNSKFKIDDDPTLVYATFDHPIGRNKLSATDVHHTDPGSMVPKGIPVTSLNTLNAEVLDQLEAIFKSEGVPYPQDDAATTETRNMDLKLEPDKPIPKPPPSPTIFKCKLKLQPLRVENFFQLRGSNSPDWYPGMMASFPDGNSSVRVWHSPSTLIKTAYTFCKP